MSVERLAERSRTTALENDVVVLAVLAAAGDPGVRAGAELAERAGLAPRTATEVTGRLVARGLARRDGKRRVWATEAGRSEAGAGAPGLSLEPTLDMALGCLPAEAQRAFARLVLAAIPARWHLAAEHADGWAGFIGLGPTKTGKTSIATLACRVYGLDEISAIRVAQHETAGSLFARRLRESSSPTGFRLERSPLLELPFACVDEWDKAAREVRSAAGGLLLGRTAAELEGERFTIRPTVYVTLNTGRDGLVMLHPAHVRRSVVLDTTPLRPLLGDVDQEMARLFSSESVAIPRLSLARMRPPAPALPAELRDELRGELRAGLSEDGWAHCDVESLSRVALGRAMLTEAPLEQAALATALDYLTCAATVTHARAGFAGRLAARLGARGALLPDPAAAEQQERALDVARTRRQLERTANHDAQREARGALAQQLRESIRQLDLRRSPMSGAGAPARSAGKGLSARLAGLSQEAGEARSAQSLAEVRERCGEPLARATVLLGEALAEQARKARLAQRLKDARSLGSVPKPYRAQAAATRTELHGLSRQLASVHGDELEALERSAEHALAGARELPLRIERDRSAQQREAQTRKQAEQMHREAAKRQAQAARDELRHVRAQIDELERLARGTATGPGKRPRETLTHITLGGRPLLAYEPTRPHARNLLEQFRGAPSGTEGLWYAPHAPALRFSGTDTGCEALTSWQGPATQQVLAAAIDTLRARATQLSAHAPPTRARARAPRSSPARRRGRSRPAASPNSRRRHANTAQPPASADTVQCPRCGATYPARGWLGRRLTCSRCSTPVTPATS